MANCEIGINIPSEPSSAFQRLLRMVAERTPIEGRSDSIYNGLRYYRFSEPTTFRKTQLLMPGLVAVLQGRKVANFSDRSVAYDPMNYLVLASEAVCDSTVVDATLEHPYLAVCLDLPPDILVKVLIALADAEGYPASEPPCSSLLDVFVSPLAPSIIGALLRLLEAVDDKIDRQVLAPIVVEEIALRLLQSDSAAMVRSTIGSKRDVQKIQGAMQYIRSNFARTLSIEQIASHVAMSPSHFAHRFQAVARVSPMRYVRQIRLNEARTLMLASGLRAGQAAENVGYETVSHFTRDFKSHFGASPTEYVRRLSGK